MNLFVFFLFLTFIGIASCCIGSGCIHDRKENRFYWFSNRASSEIENVKEQGGPAAYCTSLGLHVTSPGLTLYTRAQELEGVLFSPELPAGRENPTTLWPNKIICHEMKWD